MHISAPVCSQDMLTVINLLITGVLQDNYMARSNWHLLI